MVAMFVELDVFSGRPNPQWELDEHRSQMLLQLQNRLKVSSQAPAEPPALGYRGFWYSDATGRVCAYHGYVKTAQAVFADPSFSIERYLLDQVPAEFAVLCKRIASELRELK
jgi:hypothetical protein